MDDECWILGDIGWEACASYFVRGLYLFSRAWLAGKAFAAHRVILH